jgi:hypothetical protein
VAVHPDAVERRSGAGHHDGDRELYFAITGDHFERQFSEPQYSMEDGPWI